MPNLKTTSKNKELSKKDLETLKQKSASDWIREGEKMAINLFKKTKKEVVAYKKFLKEENLDGFQVKSILDFKKISLTTKDNYLRKFSYQELFANGEVTSGTTISATSGSTGESFFFPRNESHDFLYERMSEIFMKNQFEIDNKKTLCIIGFGLGIWIGGIFTYKNFNKISQKGYNFTLIPVGPNKDLYLKSFKKFAPFYDQVILAGYPPFVKDILDTGLEYGISWPKYTIRILTAAEGYSEKFREYLAKKAGIKNILKDIINIYGTVEQGTIAHETSFANLIRHLASQNKKLFKKIFPRATNIPTLAQYYPQNIYFEEIKNMIVATGSGSSIPLVRYQYSDLGGVIEFEEMIKKIKECNIDIYKEAKKWKIEKTTMKLPFVYVYARSDFVIVFRGANIYPGEIRSILDDQMFSKYITGKFVMLKKENKSMDHSLEINVELKKGISSSNSFINKITSSIIENLRAVNSEFNDQYTHNPTKCTPIIIPRKYNDENFFSSAGKQKWIKK
ncbi:MAG: hypothetical protein AAB837_00330 [Patescibacteria group bacterium]